MKVQSNIRPEYIVCRDEQGLLDKMETFLSSPEIYKQPLIFFVEQYNEKLFSLIKEQVFKHTGVPLIDVRPDLNSQ
jgi:hypothetical protein